MLADKTFSDVTFLVDGEHVTAHRAILAARCAYFRTMLSSHFQEGQGTEPIRIGETTPNAFRAILRYIYTDELKFDDEDVIHVMRKVRRLTMRPSSPPPAPLHTHTHTGVCRVP